MHGAASKLAGVRKLELGLYAWGYGGSELDTPAADHKDEIASNSSALAALMPGLREIKFNAFMTTPIVKALQGRLAGFYAGQLQVLHSSNQFGVPQDLVFARLRDVKINGFLFESLDGQLPRLDPEVVESLALQGFAANDMWSMFCADSDGRAITFPRLTNLDLKYIPRSVTGSGQLSVERTWALQFPALKHVRISCSDDECPSMENAVFPNRLESLDISECLCMLPAFAGRKVHVSRNMSLSVKYKHDVSNPRIDIANCMLESADNCNKRKLAIRGAGAIPAELITYTGLTHLHFQGMTNADDVMGLIHRLPHLVSLHVDRLILADAQTDFSIPECADHEPMAPLHTQIKSFVIWQIPQEELSELAFSMLKYLLLRIPTLKSATTITMPREQIQDFIDGYVQWYPHLANVKFVGEVL
ncbi:hypothetical protein H4R19_003046 [Coemansia spiralis]|nr:hypothetical protein H4R19_003046 [Coemansia spiralis]